MIRAACVCLLLSTASGVAADADTELKSIGGKWVIDAATLGGRDHLDDFEGMTLTLDSDKYTIDFKENSDAGTFTVDGSKSPKWIDIKTGAKGPFKGRSLPGIYELKDGKLTLCLNSEKQDRPTAFEAKAKTPMMLLTFAREKK
jgi:uncharacterized protein (TIGR03067 family)